MSTDPYYVSIIIKSFVNTRINLPTNRLLDFVLSIKDFKDIEIGDYNKRDQKIKKYQNRTITTIEEAEELEIVEEGEVSRTYYLIT